LEEGVSWLRNRYKEFKVYQEAHLKNNFARVIGSKGLEGKQANSAEDRAQCAITT
jgi:hypothetical protein